MNDLYSQIYREETLEEAFTRVEENRGCRGSDGISIETFARRLNSNLRELRRDLERQDYHPFPLMRFAVPKKQVAGSSGSSSQNRERSPAGQLLLPTTTAAATANFRYLSVPTVRDRVAQTAVFLVTRDIFEAEFENLSHAYRPGRGVRTALYDIKEWRDKGYRYAVDADIISYFDNIPHDLLLKKLQKLFLPAPAGAKHSPPAGSEKNAEVDANASPLLRLFEKWIKAEIYDGNKIWILEKGIPQGSVVSPHLANLFLDELDETLMSFGMKLVRYADDFLIVAKTEAAAYEAVEVTDMVLEDMKLDLNPLKTKIVSFDKGFKFLGAIFVHDGIYLPLPQKRKQTPPPKLPPPLTLKRYLELRNK